MLVSRGAAALRSVKLLAKPLDVKNHVQQSVRRSHDWYYRSCAPVDKKIELAATIAQGYAWWWILWHLWTEPEHIYGEFEYPDPSKWTDAELGIPS